MNQREVWENIAEDWSLKRKRPSSDTAEFLKNKRGMVLDLGCGSGRNFVAAKGHVIGVDFSRRMAGLARNHARKNRIDADISVADILDMPFKDGSFDVIAVSNTFHCIKWNKRKRALKEIKRVAKNGGDIFISVWNKEQPRFAGKKKESTVKWTVSGIDYDRYYYLYTKDELEALLKKFFKNVKVFGSAEKAFKRYPKNIIAIARVAK